MNDSKDKRCTYELIDSLCIELCEVKVMPHPAKRILPWFGFAFCYLAISVMSFGLRADFTQIMQNPYFLFEILLVAAMAVSAAFCTVWLCIPDMRGQKWLLVIPLILFVIFSLLICLKMFLLNLSIPRAQWHICYFEAFVYGVIPALMIIILSTRGCTTHPFLLSIMNSLAFGGLGYIGLRFTCSAEDMGHICVFHILPYIVFGVAAALVGRKLFRW